MKITVLGCGSSPGVPLIGNEWGSCDPDNPKNRRTRSSIIVEVIGKQGLKRILIDTTPELRLQLNAVDIGDIDAVLYTHCHADHCHGIDDLRTAYWRRDGRRIPIYGDAESIKILTQRFGYVLEGCEPNNPLYYTILNPHIIDVSKGVFEVEGVEILPFYQDHKSCLSVGYRFGDFAYSTDIKEFYEGSEEFLEGVKYWMVDATRPEPHNTHFNIEEALYWIEKLGVERAWFTHMSHYMDYDILVKTLPKHVMPSYDGLVIDTEKL